MPFGSRIIIKLELELITSLHMHSNLDLTKSEEDDLFSIIYVMPFGPPIIILLYAVVTIAFITKSLSVQ